MKALIVEDDKILSHTIYQCIKDVFDAEKVYDGESALEFAMQNIYDIIILDLMIPKLNGYEVLSNLRRSGILTPVLILTATDGIDSKVKGLKLGADDYLVKPFEREELIARLEAIIRRNTGSYKEQIIKFKDLKLNLQTRKAYLKDNEIVLLGKQFDMLEYLINNVNTIITKDRMFDRIWGFNSDTTTNVIEVYASGIRKELKKYGYDRYIKTVRGVGYILSGDNNE